MPAVQDLSGSLPPLAGIEGGQSNPMILKRVMVDTCILFRATKKPKILKNLRKWFIPCITDVVESEFEHLCLRKGVSLTKFLRIWAGTRRVRASGFLNFLQRQPRHVREFMEDHENDARIGFAAYKDGINMIITDNKRDFKIWSQFGIQVLSYRDVLWMVLGRHEGDGWRRRGGTGAGTGAGTGHVVRVGLGEVGLVRVLEKGREAS
ncbi:MAG: hypothetical protein JW839_03425 [Candidatus Lokiarchaeota archaeon]|nr:hypothetical protein [Candidatus Lokiarchaeota archaeon]